ncbi:MAG: PASTA domain-containing protein, partial [Solirubrobacteraceae bacterium]
RVPRLTGRSRGAAVAAARSAHVRLEFSGRYAAHATPGTVIAQQPRAGQQVRRDSEVRVVLSRGPAPVTVPTVSRESLADARKTLTGLGLQTVTRRVPAPGVTPGMVVGQSPSTGHSAHVGSIVTLSLAEVPQWRWLTTFQSEGSGPFTITGNRWRIVYRMAFQGTCTWIFFCSGPHARVLNAANGATVTSFGLNDGGQQSRTFTTGPGHYEMQITPGGDTADWSVQVQDYY